MIEAIIKRIQDGGFEVLVVTHMLVCRKWHATGECYGFDWMISKEDLACRHAASLLDEADQRMEMCKQEMEARRWAIAQGRLQA
jgi:hypothetical protein